MLKRELNRVQNPGPSTRKWNPVGTSPSRSKPETENVHVRYDASVGDVLSGDFTQKEKFKKLKTFNNNPNSRLFKVRYNPNTARGLFGASKISDCHSAAEPSNHFTKEQRHQKGDRVQESAYSSEIAEDIRDNSCHGEPYTSLLGQEWVIQTIEGRPKIHVNDYL